MSICLSDERCHTERGKNRITESYQKPTWYFRHFKAQSEWLWEEYCLIFFYFQLIRQVIFTNLLFLNDFSLIYLESYPSLEHMNFWSQKNTCPVITDSSYTAIPTTFFFFFFKPAIVFDQKLNLKTIANIIFSSLPRFLRAGISHDLISPHQPLHLSCKTRSKTAMKQYLWMSEKSCFRDKYTPTLGCNRNHAKVNVN